MFKAWLRMFAFLLGYYSVTLVGIFCSALRLMYSFLSSCVISNLDTRPERIFVSIAEVLVLFRGKCAFKVYIPSKPAKYGIKVSVGCLLSQPQMGLEFTRTKFYANNKI